MHKVFTHSERKRSAGYLQKGALVTKLISGTMLLVCCYGEAWSKEKDWALNATKATSARADYLINEPKLPQGVEIKGKVIDSNGDPLPGVTVQVKGSKIATQTDVAGAFTISPANANQVLVFSMIGYETQEVALGGQANINVTMKPSLNSLNDVVVVGYGTQKKADVTGSVVRANLDDFRNSPTTNVANLLQGTTPGLNVGQVNRAGSTPNISIRGTNTLGGNSNVLIILDGVQYTGSLTSINPDDIASIDVLKDASATAVYGAQAANGVLLITSRKGVAGKTKISFSTQYATQSPSNGLKPMRREEYLEKIRDLFYDQAYLAPDYTQPNPAFNIANVVDPSMRDAQGNISPYDFNWYKEGTRTGYIFDNQLSLSGGSEKVTFLLSGSYTKNIGFIRNDDFRRKSLRSNIETKATDWLTVGLQAFGSFVNEDGVEPGLGNLRTFSPLVRSQDDNGNFIINPYNSNLTNPFLSYQADDFDRHNYFFANIYANVQLPVKGLSYKLTYGNNYRLDQKFISNRYDANLTGQASKEHTVYYDYTLDNILTYNRTFGKHNIVGTLLYGSVERKNDYTRAYATVFDRITLGYNNLEQGLNRFAISNAYKESLSYQMARLNYSYDSKYLLTATVRRDGFSGFAENYKSAIFPSVSAGWDVARESFFKVDWVDNLKLTVGYGVVGNQTSRYSSLPRVEVLPGYQYIFGDGGTTQFGQQVNSLPNPNLRWERTQGINVGLDFALLKSRLSGRVEYYKTRTTDLLYNVNIPLITGFNQILTNIGQLNNSGVELLLNSRNVSSNKFQWNSTLSFARNVNKIVKLLGDFNGDGREDDLPQSGLFIGKPSSVIYDYQTNGIWQLTDQIPAGYSPGTYRIVDQNGDGIINNANDRTILGAGAPSFRASLLNTFKYGNFTLSVFLNSVYGGDKNYLATNTPRMVRNDNTIRDNYFSGTDFWSPRNPDGKYPRSIVTSTISPSYYQNRSFLRLQDVSLSYRFTGKLIERMNVQNISLFVSGRNLATWTNWEGWDPESDDSNRGLSSEGRPVLRGYSVGLNVTF
ncbi:SusC/RagA family TonB-linked outer membrane protein [Mucilaginibacter aquatilis]|uniref:SusC/RagA family TonB-linked outer membrane protein n=1 Tax=Mucilaginibacter aquatilis TaxID=1517760 RepID=A0A6I4I863_9SPHI|nr:TonB-dependent receptor [Mucilaginibacter aquatilis]MVN91242.1 SusC/RagA family TonB-linked outer membrane protein [Mucilaginibacter aquatilis]